MAFLVKLYSFSKRQNSTKIPGDDEGSRYTCVLKDDSSIIAPTLLFDFGDQFDPAARNYAYIPEFKRYYWITDWTHDRGQWIASLQVDVLASWRQYIGDSEQYCTRSSKYFDSGIIDSLYPATAYRNMQSLTLTKRFTQNMKNGEFVCGIINGDNQAVGCVSYYAFSYQQMRELCNLLLNSDSWISVEGLEISNDLTKILFNPFQYIVSCIWFPFKIEFGYEDVTTIKYGWWNFNTSCKRLTDLQYYFFEGFHVPMHPQAAARGLYLAASPWSEYTLFYPPFGAIPLDGSLIGLRTATGSITMYIYVDLVTGGAHMEIFTGNHDIIARVDANVGVTVQLSNISFDQKVGMTGGVAKSVIGSLFGTESPITGAVSNIANGINTAFSTVSSRGTNGDSAAYIMDPILVCYFSNPAPEDLEHYGRPACMKLKAGDYSPGYFMFSHVEIEIPCTAGEQTEIKSFMERGFFFE